MTQTPTPISFDQVAIGDVIEAHLAWIDSQTREIVTGEVIRKDRTISATSLDYLELEGGRIIPLLSPTHPAAENDDLSTPPFVTTALRLVRRALPTTPGTIIAVADPSRVGERPLLLTDRGWLELSSIDSSSAEDARTQRHILGVRWGAPAVSRPLEFGSLFRVLVDPTAAPES